jgi:decaprenyl-phosphate phosphoribosyltransferase
MKEVFRNIRISNFPKNFLILFPLIISGKFNIEIHFNTILSSLFLFFIVTSICYLINDYTDQKRDHHNKLKKNPNLSTKIFIIYLIPLIIIFIFFLIYLDHYYNFFLYLYLLNFFIYNYIGKKFKYIDLLLLTNFYLIRILYGIQAFQLQISMGFILFSFTLFFFLSVIKRLTQIRINNLTEVNVLIPYNYSDFKSLKFIFNITFASNIIISLLYYVYNLVSLRSDYNFFIYVNQFSLKKISLLYFLFLIVMFNIFFNSIRNKLNKDIYLFFISNKVNLFLLLLAAIIIFIY